MSTPAGEIRSTLHLYRKSDLLGVGSSCDVYIGIQQNTGDQHALKVFKDALWASSEERRREVAALRRLQHPNIIKFFGEEEELETGRVLLVLELCKEGSLHTYLHEPCNSRGLGDAQFLLLLDHLCAALDHLNQHKYVHRDIKPGNILRYIDYDGSCIYKLSDFGASKLLDDGELFMSLAGTEEYLHPLVYEKAFVDRGAVVCFDASVDLWSVGCTLYQAATCQIPFRPHGGARSNRTVMFQMIAQKQSGVISGYQTEEKGPITWERHIPGSSRLSPHLKTEMRPLISRLLENEPSLLISHDHFKQKVQVITQQVRITVFYLEEVTCITIYVKQNCSFAEFQDHLAGKTDVMAADQLLFHQGRMVSDLTSDGASVDSLSRDFSDPIILISKCDNDSIMKEPSPLEPPPQFEHGANVQKDCDVAHKMARFLFDVYQRISTLVDLQHFSELACICMINHLDKRQTHLETFLVKVSTRLEEIKTRQEVIEDQESRRLKVTKERNSSIMQHSRKVQSSIPKIMGELKKIKDFLGTSKAAKKDLSVHALNHSKCSRSCVSRGECLSKKGRAIWRDCYSRKKAQSLSQRSQLNHGRDKRVTEELCTSIQSLMEDHCLANWRRLLAVLKPNLERFHAMVRSLESVTERLTYVKYSLEKMETTLTQVSAFSGRAWNEVTAQLSSLRKKLAVEEEDSSSVKKELEENKGSLESLYKSLPDVDPFDLTFAKVGNG